MSSDIIIKDELRPCIVTIPAETREHYKPADNGDDRYLKIEKEIIKPGEGHKALFHCFHRTSYPKCGIVEYEDGTVHMVEPEYIRFIDRKTEEYCFRDGKNQPE